MVPSLSAVSCIGSTRLLSFFNSIISFNNGTHTYTCVHKRAHTYTWLSDRLSRLLFEQLQRTRTVVGWGYASADYGFTLPHLTPGLAGWLLKEAIYGHNDKEQRHQSQMAWVQIPAPLDFRPVSATLGCFLSLAFTMCKMERIIMSIFSSLYFLGLL